MTLSGNPHNRWFNPWYSAHISPGVQRNFPHAAMHVIRDSSRLQSLDHNVATFISSSVLFVAFRATVALSLLSLVPIPQLARELRHWPHPIATGAPRCGAHPQTCACVGLVSPVVRVTRTIIIQLQHDAQLPASVCASVCLHEQSVAETLMMGHRASLRRGDSIGPRTDDVIYHQYCNRGCSRFILERQPDE